MKNIYYHVHIYHENMGTVIDISSQFRDHAEDRLMTQVSLIADGLSIVPLSVERILATPQTALAILTPEELEKYILHDLFLRTQDGRDITPEYIFTLQYIASFVARLSPMEISYVHEALAQSDYQSAGDAALYGYIHLVGKRKNPLSHEDYMHLAVQSYLRWYERRPQSIGYIVASQLRSILPKIQNIRNDLMERVPAFHVIVNSSGFL